MLITEKKNGYVKGRAVLNGNQSRVWTTKQESSIPTAENESIMITTEIDDKEVIYIIGVDVTNTFIKAKKTKKKMDRE